MKMLLKDSYQYIGILIEGTVEKGKIEKEHKHIPLNAKNRVGGFPLVGC